MSSNLSSWQNLWNQFVIKLGPKSGTFLQSLDWGTFQKSIGREISRFLLIKDGLTRIDANINANLRHNPTLPPLNLRGGEGGVNGNVSGVMQVIKMPLPFGKSYLYIPRGPIKISNSQFLISNEISKLINDLKKIAVKEGAIFVKIELPIEENLFNELNLQPTTYHRQGGIPPRRDNLQPKSIQPKDTLILDLSKSEEELLAGMHEKTRYNIRLAERKGVEVRWARPETLEKNVETFLKLAQETAKRDRFSYHPKEYYEKMIFPSLLPLKKGGGKGRSQCLEIKLIAAEKDGEALAANIVVFFGDTVTYLHGASNYARRELMAPHLLQWRTIQEAKQLGYKYYDFWGIVPKFNLQPTTYHRQGGIPLRRDNLQPKSHPWAGITRFKLGFGGEVISYAPALDLPVNNFWYKIYSLAKILRL